VIEVSRRIEPEPEPGWDAFVEASRGGSHLQTTLWARVKRDSGWEPGYVTATEAGMIVGGCQLLLRRIRGGGTVAYVPRGPVIAEGRSDVTESLTTALLELLRARRFTWVTLQPPEHQDALVARLRGAGWMRSMDAPAPEATTRVLVQREDDELMRSLRPRTARQIRSALRAGGTVREGSIDDVETFSRLYQATGSRQGLLVYPTEYHRLMVSSFAGRAHLLFVDYDGEPYAASLLIAFGDTVTCKTSGWSGERSELHASKLLHWGGFRLARELGCRYYDFDGISRQLAEQLLAGEDVSREGLDFFKLGFRGEVVLFPQALDRSYHLLGPAVQWVVPRVTRYQRLEVLMGRRSAASLGDESTASAGGQRAQEPLDASPRS
jgi:peptidoglycan pentaglycine glycine transferase (the first glycine)